MVAKKNESPTSVTQFLELDESSRKELLLGAGALRDDGKEAVESERLIVKEHNESTKFLALSRQGEQDFLRRLAAFELLYHMWACPARWFFPQESGRPRVGFWIPDCFPWPQPFTPLAIWSEHAMEAMFALSILFLLVAPPSLSTGKSSAGSLWLRYAGFLMAAAYVGLELFDATRASGVEIHSVALLLITASAEDGLVAARIATGGTWFWAGFQKVNPGFLQSYTLADPMVDRVFGEAFAAKHRVALHLMAAIGETMVGLVMLLTSRGPKATADGTEPNWIVRSCVIFCGVFLASMHIMLANELYDIQWDIIVIGKNLQCAFLAIWLWRSYWFGRPEASPERVTRSSRLAVMGAIAVFVVLPAGLPFGITDPYLGVSLYSDNNPEFTVEFPSQLSDFYEKMGFLQWPRPTIWSLPPVPASSVDGREVIRRNYILLNAAATVGHEGYPAEWYYKRYASKMCEQIRAAAAERAMPKAVDDARFIIEPHYTGKHLFQAMATLLLSSEEVEPLSLLVREGCHEDSEQDWKPLHQTSRYFAAFSLKSGSPPVDIYYIGRATNGMERPQLFHAGRVMGDTLLYTNAWAGAQLLVARGGKKRDYSLYSETKRLCAVDVLVISESSEHWQEFEIDSDHPSGRTVKGLQVCSSEMELDMEDDDDDFGDERVVHFQNEGESSIDVLWLPADRDDPPVTMLHLSPGETETLGSFLGHRFRAVISGKDESCHNEGDFVVDSNQLNIRHAFCGGSEGESRTDQGNDGWGSNLICDLLKGALPSLRI